jgi:hypothetical protein
VLAKIFENKGNFNYPNDGQNFLILCSMQPLLDDLLKKDPDLQVINDDPENFIVRTTVDVGTVEEEEEEEEEEDEGEKRLVFPRIAINIRVVRYMFGIHALTSFLIVIFGIVPYYLMLPYGIVSKTLLIASACTTVLFYIGMHLVRNNERWNIPFFVMWIFNQFALVCSLSSTLGVLAPFQAYLMFFVESISVMLLGFCFEKRVDPWWAGFVMAISGAGVWGIGIYAFIKDQDWILSGALFILLVVIAPTYSGLFISKVNKHRYHLGGNEIGRAVVEFYTDPITK